MKALIHLLCFIAVFKKPALGFYHESILLSLQCLKELSYTVCVDYDIATLQQPKCSLSFILMEYFRDA